MNQKKMSDVVKPLKDDEVLQNLKKEDLMLDDFGAVIIGSRARKPVHPKEERVSK